MSLSREIQDKYNTREKCPKQTNGNDSGVYDHSSISFNVAAMRKHLLQGLQNKKITVFPHRKLSFVKKPVLKVTGIPIFCTCRMPEHGFITDH